MPNHLIDEISPYLLQHANNPVDWYPWGAEALIKAKDEDKPIFLSIGYAACHWCHVMAHESFEDPSISAIMNQYFINIKVDREERPDLDNIYMQAVIAMTGQGGWPMSVFITPAGKPFYGGTYFPPLRHYHLPAFREVLLAIANLWRDDRAGLLESGDRVTEHLQQQPAKNQSTAPLDEEKLKQATANLAQTYDWKFGGWGKAPKFPQPMTIEYLLQQGTRGDKSAIEIATHVLHAMGNGGMYDVVGGGFARYSTDDFWRTPHFEKMLYDNAQLALVYLHGWLIIREPMFRRVCEETLDFLIREMNHHLGGFYSSLDADTDGEEGKYYVWTPMEIQAALNNTDDINLFTAAYDITSSGNFEGKNVLQRVLDDEQIAQKFNVPIETIPSRLRNLHNRLLTSRSERVRPETDDKILTAWNGYVMKAFSEAGRYLCRDDYRRIAQQNADFLIRYSYKNGRLSRAWREGQASGHIAPNAFLEDYASLILGLLSLYQTDLNNEWYKTALSLADEMIMHFADQDETGKVSGFFDTRDDHEPLLYRPKNLQDNATPSGNALAATALLQLAAYEGRNEWRKLAEYMLTAIQETIVRYPTAFAQWLCALDFAIGPIDEIAIIGDACDPKTIAIHLALWKDYHPRQVVASSNFPPEPGSPRLLMERPLKNNLPTAYVCHGFVCHRPTNSIDDMMAMLAG